MCGRFVFRPPEGEVWDEIRVERRELELTTLKPNYNVAPTASVATIINDGEANHLKFMRWGLIPSWAKDKSIGSKMINARAETLAEKPSFRNAFKRRRCLILADSFFEWRKIPDQKTKQPYRIGLKNWKPFAFAGLWETWDDPEGDLLHSCTIITCEPNSFMERIHNRMPVILPNDEYATWLDPENQDTGLLRELLVPIPSSDMDAHPVTVEVGNPKVNMVDLIMPLPEDIHGIPPLEPIA